MPKKLCSVFDEKSIQCKLLQKNFSVKVSTLKKTNLEQCNISFDNNKDAISKLLSWVRNKSNYYTALDLFYEYTDFNRAIASHRTALTIKQLESLFFCEADISKQILKFDPVVENEGILENVRPGLIKQINNSMGSWVFFVGGHGSAGSLLSAAAIASLKPKQFQKLLLFFNSMNVHLVAISSCSSGGTSLDYAQFKKNLHTQNISQNLRYILAILSSQDDSTYVSSAYPSRFDQFFTYIRNQENENWLQNALHAVTTPEDISLNQIPQVLMPGANWFTVPLLQKKAAATTHATICALTMTALKKHSLEKSIFVCNNAYGLLIYPTYIPISINLRPREITMLYEPIKPVKPWSIYSLIGVKSSTEVEYAKAIKEYEDKMKEYEKKYYTDTYRPCRSYRNLFPYSKKLFPCIADTLQENIMHTYPQVLSMQRGSALHVFKKIELTQSDNCKTSGILTFLRDAFFNIGQRSSFKVFFIHELVGNNDLSPMLVELRKLKNQTTPTHLETTLEKAKNQIITLHDVSISTYYKRGELGLFGNKSFILPLFKYCQKENITYWAMTVAENFSKATNPLWNFKQISEQEFIRQYISIKKQLNLSA